MYIENKLTDFSENVVDRLTTIVKSETVDRTPTIDKYPRSELILSFTGYSFTHS